MSDAEPTEPQPFRGHHTAGQRLVLVVNCIIVVLCLAAATGLIIGKNAGENGRKVIINAATTLPAPVAADPGPAVTAAPGQTLPGDTGTPETFPEADPEAMNFLITGDDNSTDKSCIDLADKGARTGERSDTIMIIRLDPVTKRAAVLSFPRDLYVKIPGRGTQRINGAFSRDDPQLLIDTINNEFGVGVDHYIQIDFCAFQRLVKGIGGVSVPMPYPVRDSSIGLEVLDGVGVCHRFDGDEALKYVRSRHLEYMDDKGKWHDDPSSDLGRIARQQDFLRRTLTAALKQNVFKPKVLASLYASYKEDVVVDQPLTIDKMIEFAGVIRDVKAATIRTYQIEATGKIIHGSDVLIWHKDSENMQAILNIFRGQAPLASAPEQQFEDVTTTSTIPHGTTTVSPTGATEAPAGTQPVETTPAAPVDTAPVSNTPKTAIVPDPNVEC